MAIDESIVRKILLEYERKRDNAEYESKRRKEDLYSKYPQLEKIDDEISRVGLSVGRMVLLEKLSKEDALKKCDEAMAVLKKRKKDIYEVNNVPVDYLDIKYNCNKCKDRAILPDGKKCTCYTQRLIGELQGMSNMEHLMSDQNFQKFDWNIFGKEDIGGITQYKNMCDNVTLAKRFIENFDKKDEKSMIFLGDPGTGKTYLSSCIAKAVIDNGFTVVYKTCQDLIDLAKSYRFEYNKENESEEYKIIQNCDLLIIDDLGTEIEGKLSLSEIFNIINSRVVAGKKMLISTNLNLKEIDVRYTNRVFSRIIQSCKIISFVGEDLRIKSFRRSK